MYITTTMCDGVLHCLLFLMFFWCPYMAINVSVQFNGGRAPDIILLTQSMLLSSGNPFKCHEEVLFLQPMILPKRFDIFPPVWDTRKV